MIAKWNLLTGEYNVANTLQWLRERIDDVVYTHTDTRLDDVAYTRTHAVIDCVFATDSRLVRCRNVNSALCILVENVGSDVAHSGNTARNMILDGLTRPWLEWQNQERRHTQELIKALRIRGILR